MIDKLKYWLKKYTPTRIQKIFYIARKTPELINIGLFSFGLEKNERMSQLTWSYSGSSSPGELLISKSIDYINNAKLVNLELDNEIENNSSRQYEFEYKNMNNFPGEHYRLLVSVVNTEKFKNFTEIGTGSGIASKVVLQKTDCSINTFDIVPWVENNSHLTKKEFNNERLQQHVENLGSKEIFNKNIPLLVDSNLILLDANKDGRFENLFLSYLSKLNFKNEFRILFIDDIRYFTMYEIWKNIKSPKLDLTSFGHWSGSGLVDISNGLDYKGDK